MDVVACLATKIFFGGLFVGVSALSLIMGFAFTTGGGPSERNGAQNVSKTAVARVSTWPNLSQTEKPPSELIKLPQALPTVIAFPKTKPTLVTDLTRIQRSYVKKVEGRVKQNTLGCGVCFILAALLAAVSALVHCLVVANNWLGDIQPREVLDKGPDPPEALDRAGTVGDGQLVGRIVDTGGRMERTPAFVRAGQRPPQRMRRRFGRSVDPYPSDNQTGRGRLLRRRAPLFQQGTRGGSPLPQPGVRGRPPPLRRAIR